MFIVSKALPISSTTVIVRAWGAIWFNPFATVLFSVKQYMCVYGACLRVCPLLCCVFCCVELQVFVYGKYEFRHADVSCVHSVAVLNAAFCMRAALMTAL